MASSLARQGGRTRGRIGGYPVTAIAKRALLAFAVKSGLSTVQHQQQQQQPTLATGHLPPPTDICHPGYLLTPKNIIAEIFSV